MVLSVIIIMLKLELNFVPINAQSIWLGVLLSYMDHNTVDIKLPEELEVSDIQMNLGVGSLLDPMYMLIIVFQEKNII